MATLVLTPSQGRTGQSVVVTGASWSTNPVTVEVISPVEDSGVKMTLTPSGGNITSAGVCEYRPGKEGIYTFRATDGTTTVTSTLTVNRGGA